MADAERALKNFALGTSARVSSDNDHGLGADRAESVDNETIGELVAKGAG